MRLFSTTMIVMILLAGCTQIQHSSDLRVDKKSEGTPKSNQEVSDNTEKEADQIIKIGWEFEYLSNKGNDDVPLTRVYLKVGGIESRKEFIGEYTGWLDHDSPETNLWGFPDDSIIACFGWYAGSGDLLAVICEKPDILVVKHNFIGESGGDPEFVEELDNMKFETIKTIVSSH